MVDFHRPGQTPPWIAYRKRYYVIIAILLLGLCGLLGRLIYLTVINRAFLQGQGDARTLRTVAIPAYRGMILDRNGEPLAISTPVDSVWINPKDFDPSKTDLYKLDDLLGMSRADMNSKINKAHDHEFLYLKRDLDPSIGAAVKNLGIPGLYIEGDYRRYYPEGPVTAHVLGFTNIDDRGQEGMELAYNNWLQGVTGLKRVLKDRYGHEVADVDVIKAPRSGENLTLSIDHRMQYFAYQELQAGVEKYKADSGSVVILDVHTGEILAMVNYPSFNPNNRPAVEDGRYRNRAVTDLFEPGSTIKSFSMASALASGKYQVNSHINTSPGWMIVSGKKIDDDGYNRGDLDLTGILQHSSNVGMSKIIISLPPENLWNILHNVGLGQLTASNFPGERSGILMNYPVWDPFVLATMSWGYGVSVTALQIAQAYMILAADGVKRPVTFLKIDKAPQGQPVIKPQVAHDILTMLESVLTKGGTAPLARVPGYRVTGKTGTVRIVGPHGYEKNHHNAIFVGIAPASDPRLVIAVVLHDPQGTQYYGGYTSGPIFSRIMGDSLRLLNVPPDDLTPPKPLPENVAPPPDYVD